MNSGQHNYFSWSFCFHAVLQPIQTHLFALLLIVNDFFKCKLVGALTFCPEGGPHPEMEICGQSAHWVTAFSMHGHPERESLLFTKHT